MTSYSESWTSAILENLYAILLDSFFVRVLTRFGRFIKRVWSASFIRAVLVRPGAAERALDGSIAARIVNLAVSIPSRACTLIYNSNPDIWGNSAAVKVLRGIGEHTEVFLGLLLFGTLSVPQESWNNFYSLFAVVAIFAVFALRSLKSAVSPPNIKLVGVWSIFFAGITLVFTIVSTSIGASLRFFVFHLTGMLAVLLTVSSVKSKRQLKNLIVITLTGLAVCGAFAFLQRMQGIEVNPSFTDLTRNKLMPGRVYSFFENPNTFAMVIVMFLPFGIAGFFYGKGLHYRLFCGIIFAISAGALLMTYSRGAWIGAVGSIGLFVLIMRPMLAPLGMMALVLVFPFLPAAISDRIMTLFSGNDTSISSRAGIYAAALSVIKEHPISGAGLGSDTVGEYVRLSGFFVSNARFTHGHNLFLQITAETGLFGLITFCGAMAQIFKRGFIAVSGALGHDKELKSLIAAGIAGLAGVIVCGLGDYPWFYPRVMLMFWMLAAVIPAGAQIAINHKQED
ncbi:MAG: O-antigen ligase family protein [Oscillospiraceae bacterium]|jgi:O-antigen ligase|nr:O-antigen ligase family protein [Oscillospiraceae bacterium]